MINKVQSNPEAIHVATDYVRLGKPVELNRQRITNVVYSITQANTEAQLNKLNDITSDKTVTDAEKVSLRRELESLIRDYDYISTEATNAEVLDTEEYLAMMESYQRLVELLGRIVNSVGTYTNTDVTYITSYYTDYTDKAKILEALILNKTATVDRIADYYARTKVNVSIYPEAVPVNTTTEVRASVLYNGEEKIDVISPSAIKFGVAGLASGATSSMFTIPSGGSIEIYPLTNSAMVENCKYFEMAYNAIGETGVSVNCEVELDSDSMPF